MPDPQPNPWECNPWEPDGREAAACPAVTSAPNWSTPLEEPVALGTVRDSRVVYEELLTDWPDIAPVIPDALFVSQQDPGMEDKVLKKYGSLQCYWWACYQLFVATSDPRAPHGFATTTKDTSAATYYQTYVQASEDRNTEFKSPQAKIDACERGTIDVERTAAAIRYIRSALRDKTPVLVGIRMWGYGPSPNPEGGARTTNHFLVVVGMGTDVLGPRLICYDKLSPKGTTHSFYLSPWMRLDDVGSFCTIAQVRESVRL